ncbi:Na(+)/H(+) antiporter subunit B [Paenibacillus yanchengensis]|uniref:Na(+)/H(+) antiporter subunit B n=1 Tax=Paenibacillus yanchengensis TaxID=2035833 RepID=A0ABW4YH46_9BACL
MKFKDTILQTAAKVLVFIIITFSIYILFAGHNNPGGGFIGGLITSSALLLLYLAFDAQTVFEILPMNFRVVAAIGLLLAFLTGVGALLFDVPFLTQYYEYHHVPLLGKTAISSALIFDLGVYFTVVGTTMTIIQSISEDI